MTHCDSVVDGDGVEFLGDAPGVLDFTRDELPEVFQVNVARNELVKEFTTAMIGLPKSSFFMPVARHSPRAPPCCGRGWWFGSDREACRLFLKMAGGVSYRPVGEPIRG